MGRSLWVWGRRRPPSAETPKGGRSPLPSLGVTLGRLLGALEALLGGRSPLPSLGVTLGRLLGALEALLPPPERARTRELLRDFGGPGGAGPRLQERLRRGPERPSPPRLPEWPWGSSERLPLPVHTSAGLVLPRLDWEDWRGQLWFAARLLSGVLDYREQLQRRDPPEPWLQAALGGCRVPGSRRDEVLRVPPGAAPPPFVTVSCNGQFFQVGVATPQGHAPPPPALLGVLGGLRARAGGGGAGAHPPVGLLTGQHRRDWGRVHGHMTRDRLSRASLGRIQRSLLVLSLDSPVLASPGGRGPEGGAAQVLHGGGAGANSANRWWDKTLQLVVGQDGTCGALYDPAVIDGAVVAEMLDHALEHSRQLGPAPPAMATPSPLPPPQRLRFSIDPEIAAEVERAKRHLDSLAADVELRCFEHPGFGAGAGPSPEALVQVALQVAFYRAHGSLCATCEPLSLRQVLPGCTDLLRPPGPPCLALARALDDPEAQPQVLLALLREAVQAQESRTQEVLSGRGPERHLQRLREAALSSGEPLPEIFLDPGYAQATHFRLCTLQVRSREGSWLLRGPLVPDGYGVGVGHLSPSPTLSPEPHPSPSPTLSPSPHPSPSPPSGRLRVAVTSFRCCRETSAERLGGAIQGVFDQVGALLRGRGLG